MHQQVNLKTRTYLLLTKKTKLTTNGLDHLNQDVNDVTDSLLYYAIPYGCYTM